VVASWSMDALIVEDNERLAASLSRGLTEEGFTVEATGRARSALERLRDADVDAVVLDLGLPDMDGLDVISALRKSGNTAPILVLTARDAVSSRVEALDRGADDYLVKPFAFEELLARLRALLRRAAAPRRAPLAMTGMTLQPEGVVLPGATLIPLSPREHALLALLLRRREEVLSREEILREAFGYEFNPGTNLLDVHVAHLRHKLEGAPVRIETIRGTGFRLVPLGSDDH
jgi:DNA-binding response OmpR family regulator